MTWPHLKNNGGFSGVLISLETGQTNTEWYLNYFPISISIGNSCVDFQASFLSFI